MNKKRQKEYDDDDGRTVVNMNVDGMHGYIEPKHRKNIEEIQKLRINKKERRAIFWGSFLAALPGILITGACLLATFFLMYLWLK